MKGVVIAVMLSALGASARSEAQQDPGTIAKIAALAAIPLNLQSPDTPRLLSGGLIDSEPSVRAAAARVGHSIGARGLVPELRTALTTETDPEAASEMAWGLADLDVTGSDELLKNLVAANTSVRAELISAVELASRGLDSRASLLAAIGGGHLPVSTSASLVTKTVEGYPKGFLASVLIATKCKGRPDSFQGAEIEFRPGGRPKSVGIMRAYLDAACRTAMEMLAYAALSADPDRNVLLILPTQPEFVACRTQGKWPMGRKVAPVDLANTGGSTLKEPKKVRGRPPVYPNNAKSAGVEGAVVLRALIDTQGCVSELRVEKSSYSNLEVAALNSVASWVYEPTVFNGIPMPAKMTITVTFKLN